MERRHFLKAAASAGLMVSLPFEKLLASDPYQGPFLIQLHADGGWDTSALFDPKGKPINSFESSAIRELGPFRIAPYLGKAQDSFNAITGQRESGEFFLPFFQKYQKDLLVIRGMDMGTNSHLTGRAYANGASLGANWPTLAAISSGLKAPDLPLSYLAYGSYAETAGLLPATRAGNGQGFVDALRQIIEPNATQANGKQNWQHPELWQQVIQPAIQNEGKALAAQKERGSLAARASTLHALRLQPRTLAEVLQYLPEKGLTTEGNPLFAQIEIICAAFRAGAAVGASLSLGGFDTHEEHDAHHGEAMTQLLRAVDYLFHRLEILGLRQQTTLLITSDFGRTPLYQGGTLGTNEKLGKDHYPIGGMMLMGRGITGNRVIGATDDKLMPIGLSPQSLAPVGKEGLILRPEHVHLSLRRLMGLDSHPALQRFLLDVPQLPLLG